MLDNWGTRFVGVIGNLELEKEYFVSQLSIGKMECLMNLPGNAERRGGDSHGSIGIPAPLQPIRCGNCEKCDRPKRKLSDFS